MRLMRWVASVVVVMIGGKEGRADERMAQPPVPAVLPDPGPLESVVASAARDGKPLVIEFYTTWCAPCKQFDAGVLPDPKVQSELTNIRFVRYDAERGSGIAAAEKYRINAFPTFLAVDDKGEVRMKRSGAESDPGWFVDFLQRGSMVVQSEDRVLAARKRAPGDARVADTTARWYVEHDRPADALAHFDAAVVADKSNALGVAAEAAWAAAGIRRTSELRARITKELLAHVRAYPGGKHAIQALTVATVGGDVAPAERRALWQMVVDAHKAAPATTLNDLVYRALAAGELDAALAAAQRQVEVTNGSANSYDSLAEVHHFRREKPEAVARADQAIALVKDEGDGRVMQANRARFAADTFVPQSGVLGIKRQVTEVWKQVGSIERSEGRPEEMSAMMASLNAYRVAKNEVLADAGKQCAAHAGKLTEAYVRLDLRGAHPAVTVLEPDASAALKRCLVDKLRKASYPKLSAGSLPKSVDRVPLKDRPMPGMH
jgi:thiol-disulfide isomerase/thioredoxin